MIRSLLRDVKLEEEPTLCYDKAMTNHPKALLRALIILLLLILYTTIIGIVSFPTVKRAFHGGVLQLIRVEEQTGILVKRMVSVVFAPLGTSFAIYTVESRARIVVSHDTFEALLWEFVDTLKDGAITPIASGTKLLGPYRSSNIIYLNLSKSFSLHRRWSCISST